MRLLKFNKTYFVLTILIFGIEILIAKFAKDQIVRPYIGDLLVVILIYCFIRSFLDTPVLKTVLFVWLFSFTIEFLQYFHIVDILGLQDNKIARIIIGTSFAWMDLVAYTLGILLVLFVEKATIHRTSDS